MDNRDRLELLRSTFNSHNPRGRWFAWYPVRGVTGKLVWLRMVQWCEAFTVDARGKLRFGVHYDA